MNEEEYKAARKKKSNVKKERKHLIHSEARCASLTAFADIASAVGRIAHINGTKVPRASIQQAEACFLSLLRLCRQAPNDSAFDTRYKHPA